MSIKINSLSFSIGERELLTDIDLEIPPNKLTILIGPNGAGKSTLLKICSGDTKPTTGNIELNNRLLEDYSPKELSMLRSVLTQSYEMAFSFSVEEVVNMGCFSYEELTSAAERQKIVTQVMEYLAISPLAKRNFMQLSGGEQQRTQLARVLTQLWFSAKEPTPRYLLLDEPTSSLDIFHQYHVLSLTNQLSKRNIGVLAVVHDLALAATYADNLVLLCDGKIVAQGTPEAVLSKKNMKDVYDINGAYFRHSQTTMPTLLLDQ